MKNRNFVLSSECTSYKVDLQSAKTEVVNLKSEVEKNNASFDKIKNGYNTSMEEMKNKLKSEMIKLINANKSLKEELSNANATIEDLDQQLIESEKIRRSSDEQLQRDT